VSQPEDSYTGRVANLDVLRAVQQCEPGRGVLVTVVATTNSTPLPAGTQMFISSEGEVVGSISGGCVESDVVASAFPVLDTGRAVRKRYGVSDADAFSVGLMCGGSLEVVLQPVDQSARDIATQVAGAANNHRPVVWGLVSSGELMGQCFAVQENMIAEASAPLKRTVQADAGALLSRSRATELRTYGEAGQRLRDDIEVFFCAEGTPPRLVVFGAVDFSRALTQVAGLLGWQTSVVDARETFTTPGRFPEADEVVVAWPDSWLSDQLAEGALGAGDAVCVLTHDPRFDVPALRVALASAIGYVGAMGSRATHADRHSRLQVAGVPTAQLAALRSPIGLDIGGATPEETAVSIMAEIIAVRAGRSARPLRESAGSLHDVAALD